MIPENSTPLPLEEIGLFERMEKHPDTIDDATLLFLMKTHEKSRGRNAQIPAKCLLIWDRRHSPTEAKR